MQGAFPHHLPLVPGWDVAGTMLAVRPAVREVAVGDRVAAYEREEHVQHGTFAERTAVPAGLIDPAAQYDHDEGVATIGGFVHRGAELPRLQGRYVFGDYSDGFTSANGRVLVVDEDYPADPHQRTPNVFNLTNGHINLFVLGFGEDARGELYVLVNHDGIPFEEEGVVMKVVRRCADGADCRN